MRRAVALAIAVGCLVAAAGGVGAAPIDYAGLRIKPEATDIRNPDWDTETIGPISVPPFVPAKTDFQGGEAVVRCLIRADGTLERCVVLRERPEGQGLGAYAAHMAPLVLKLKPSQHDGKLVAGRTVVIPMILQGNPADAEAITAQSKTPR